MSTVHKFPDSIPTIGFLRGKFRKHIGQRFTFEVLLDSTIGQILIEHIVLKSDQPMYANGIFVGIFRVAPNGQLGHTTRNKLNTILEFRDVLFQYGDQRIMLFKNRQWNKTFNIGFEYNMIKGVKQFALPSGIMRSGES